MSGIDIRYIDDETGRKATFSGYGRRGETSANRQEGRIRKRRE
jgi:hypothetical protein